MLPVCGVVLGGWSYWVLGSRPGDHAVQKVNVIIEDKASVTQVCAFRKGDGSELVNEVVHQSWNVGGVWKGC